MTFGPDGTLYVSGKASANVVRFDLSDPRRPMRTLFGTGIEGANGLAFGPNGNLYVASEFGNAVVQLDGRTGQSLGVFARVTSPIGIAFAPVPEPTPRVMLLVAAGVSLLSGRRRTRIRIWPTRRGAGR